MRAVELKIVGSSLGFIEGAFSNSMDPRHHSAVRSQECDINRPGRKPKHFPFILNGESRRRFINLGAVEFLHDMGGAVGAGVPG